MTATLAFLVIALTAAYLGALGILCWFAPKRACQFLSHFASSLRAHLLEISIRIVVGLALIQHAALMRFSELFAGVGYVLIASSLVLIVLPWRWHQRFAASTVPWAIRVTGSLGFGAFASALFIGWALLPQS